MQFGDKRKRCLKNYLLPFTCWSHSLCQGARIWTLTLRDWSILDTVNPFCLSFLTLYSVLNWNWNRLTVTGSWCVNVHHRLQHTFVLDYVFNSHGERVKRMKGSVVISLQLNQVGLYLTWYVMVWSSLVRNPFPFSFRLNMQNQRYHILLKTVDA